MRCPVKHHFSNAHMYVLYNCIESPAGSCRLYEQQQPTTHTTLLWPRTVILPRICENHHHHHQQQRHIHTHRSVSRCLAAPTCENRAPPVFADSAAAGEEDNSPGVVVVVAAVGGGGGDLLARVAADAAAAAAAASAAASLSAASFSTPLSHSCEKNREKKKRKRGDKTWFALIYRR